MTKITYLAARCKGCHLCTSVCPKDCISKTGEFNAGGYETVAFNEEDCIACGSCYSICPDYAIQIVKED